MKFNAISLIKNAFTLLSSSRLTMVDDGRKATPKLSRALSPKKQQCDDLTAVEPNWQGQWRVLKYV
jgi:hypothetical protein